MGGKKKHTRPKILDSLYMHRQDYKQGGSAGINPNLSKGEREELHDSLYHKLGVARINLDGAAKTGNLSSAIRAAKTYDELGKIGTPYVRKKLKKALDNVKDPNSISNKANVMSLKRFLKKSKEQANSTLEQKATATASIIGILGGLLFLSPNITGNVIGNLTNSTSNWIGGVLFALGLAGVYFWNKF